MALDLPRRKFLTGLGSLFVAAPAIVHVANIMPVRALGLITSTVDELLIVTKEIHKEIHAADALNYTMMERWRDAMLPGLRQAVQRYDRWPEIDWSSGA
jgi:hypothetical protein